MVVMIWLLGKLVHLKVEIRQQIDELQQYGLAFLENLQREFLNRLDE